MTFTQQNTDGHTDQQLEKLNAELEERLSGLEVDSDEYQQAEKSFADEVAARPAAPRYEIYAVANENCDAIRAELLSASDDLATAKHLASEVVSPWGAAILDTESALIDYGFGFGVPVPEQGQDI